MPEVPIYRKGEVITYALVDEEDYARVLRYRWHLERDYPVASPKRGVKLRLGRFVLRLVTRRGDANHREVDHRNGDPLDNRKSNLRRVTRAENGQNVIGRPGASRFRGVYLDRSRRTSRCWRARVRLAGRSHHVGWFATEEEAAAAASAWRRAHMPYTNEERLAAT